MKAIHIRNVEPRVLSALKRLAAAHHRSLQGELHVLLQQAARMAPAEKNDRELGLITVQTGGTSTWSREEIYGDGGR